MRQYLPNAKIIWNPNIGFTNPFPYYPGDDLVDAIGPDAYCQPQGYATSADCWNDYLSGDGGNNLNAYASFSLQHNKPIVIPEWGDTFGDGYYITQMGAWIANNNVVAHTFWDTADGLGSTSYLPSLTTNQQAYVAAFGHRTYAGNFLESHYTCAREHSRAVKTRWLAVEASARCRFQSLNLYLPTIDFYRIDCRIRC